MNKNLKSVLRIIAIVFIVFLILERAGVSDTRIVQSLGNIASKPLVFIIRYISFPVFFVFMGLLMSFIVSKKSGWSKLAGVYAMNKNQHLPENIKYKLSSARINDMRYNSCLKIGANEQGMIIKVLFLLRFCHPPLLIPWGRIKSIKPAPAQKVSLFNFYVPGEFYVVELLDDTGVDIKIFKHSLNASTVPQYYTITDE